MHPIVLRRKVIIKGPNFWGFKAKITFSPTGQQYGWWWQNKGLPSLPINTAIIDEKARRLRLVFENKRLEIYEHIGILRWFGLCEIFIASSSWPPYYGRPLEFWQALKPFCEKDTSRGINWYTVKEPVRWDYPNFRGGQQGFTEIYPNTNQRLEIQVTGSYPGLGAHTEHFSFPDAELLEEICTIGNQGWPQCIYCLSKIVSACGWPHHKSAVWVQEHGKKEALRLFVVHRTVDLLGGLSILCRDGLLAAHVVSQCSGHEADFQAILKARSLLYRLT